MFIYLLIFLSITINCRESLKIRASNFLTGGNNYSCILDIGEITKLNENIKYIVFDFVKEEKEKRNKIYISSKENEATNIGTIFKLPLFGSNKIIIPYDYIKSENILFVKIFCYENKKCDEEIYINVYDKILIEEGETLYINGYKEKYEYDFIYNYQNKDDNNIIKQISAYSYQKNDFDLKISHDNKIMNTQNIINGYICTINNEEYKENNFDINIKTKKSSSYIILQIISIDNNIKYNSIELIRPIIGILNKEDKEKCFYIDEKEKKSNDYFIDFMIENDLHSLIFEYNDKEFKNILMSQTINYFSEGGKFCIKKLYPNQDSISFYFTVYLPEDTSMFSTYNNNQYIVHKSYFGLLYNGYFYKKLVVESTNYNDYFPAEYNSDVVFFYIYATKGILKVSNIATNNFPYSNINNEKMNNEETFEIKSIKNIGNEYFGKVIIKNKNINSSPMNSHKNLFLVQCESGVKFKEDVNNYCQYNIICYTENDLIKLKSNEKFSFINYNKINLNLEVSQNFELNRNKLIIDTYTHFGSSYINIINKDENSDLNTYYNGHLISHEIIYDYKKNKDNLINYALKAISYDYDYVSIIITGNIDSEDDVFKTRFWINDYILTTLTKRISKKHFKIDHIPNAVTDINIFKTYFLFKYSNCDVEAKLLYNKNIQSNFQNIKDEKIDNTQLISFEGYHSETKNIIEFELNLKNTYYNEPVCMIYFSSYMIIDMNFDTLFLYPILIKENTDTPIFLESDDIIQLEYIVFNFDSPIIISISFEEMIDIYFSYSIEGTKRTMFNIYFSQNIIIYQKEIKEKCTKDKNEENKLCKIKLEIGKNKKSIFKKNFFAKKSLINIKVKSNYENHVNYLNINTVTDDMILGDQFQYYYTNIRKNDAGVITLNNKKGLGIMYARIINKNTVDKNPDKNWNGRIHLLNKKELEQCEDCLIYNINTNEIVIDEQYTKDCESDLRCQLIIGVSNIENKNDDNANEYSVYEYSIYFLKYNMKNMIFWNLKIQSNKYIKLRLDGNNSIIYQYYLPENTENIKYELQCKSCSFSLIDEDLKIEQKINDGNNIKKFGMNLIEFPNNDIKKYYNKIIYLKFSAKENDLIFFRTSLLFNGTIENYSFLTSEMNSICYKECYYLIPIYDYDKLTSLTMSISDKDLNSKLDTELDFKIYNSINYYSYIMFKDYTYSYTENYLDIKPNIENISSKKNYIVFENKNGTQNMMIIGHVKIKNNLDIKDFEPFYVYFTYSKNSRKNYFLYPGINNLLYINKNSETENIKEVKIPDYHLIKSSKDKQSTKDLSIITFSHIKGEGVIELITNNIYIHNNINKLYTELKSFRFDLSHSLFQINYEKNSNFSKKFFINSNTGLYTYANIKTNLERNINEIKLGKANYILNRYDGSNKYLYFKIENEQIIKNDIIIDVKIEGLDVYNYYDISINGYISNDENFINSNILLSKGFYDNITNIGIIKFNSKDIIKHYNKDKTNILLIFINFNFKENSALDIMIKATPILSLLNPLNDEKYETPIPQFEHFFSFFDITNNKFIIFKLNTINPEHHYISIELHFLNEKETDFSLHSDKTHLSNDDKFLYKNETNSDSFSLVDERNQNGKRSVILKLENKINEIYLVLFIKENIENIKNEFFSLKYYGLSDIDYQKGNYLYKKRFTINNTKLKINDEQNIIKWEKIKLMNLKEEKGEINIDYYLKIKRDIDNLVSNNNGLFGNFIQSKDNYGIHLINKNEYKLSNNIEGNLQIYLIAKFNEINGMENFLLYEPLILTKESKDNNQNQKSDNINNNDESDDRTNEKKSEEQNNNVIKNILIKILIIILILIVILLIVLSIFKLIRKIQIKNAYNKYIKGNDNNGKAPLFDNDKLPFESKISFLIEN